MVRPLAWMRATYLSVSLFTRVSLQLVSYVNRPPGAPIARGGSDPPLSLSLSQPLASIGIAFRNIAILPVVTDKSTMPNRNRSAHLLDGLRATGYAHPEPSCY